MLKILNSRLSKWFFAKYAYVPLDATIVKVTGDSVHYTYNFKDFVCRQMVYGFNEALPLKILRYAAFSISALFTKGASLFFLIVNNGSTNNKDTMLISTAATTNYGSNSTVETRGEGSASVRHTLISFTLSSGSGTISRVSLFMYGTESISGATTTIEAHQLSANTNWGEATATWNKYDGTNNWTTAGGDYSATVIHSKSWTASEAAYKQFDLMGGSATNPLTLTWGNAVHLLFTGTAAEKGIDFNTKENGSNKPYLEIEYTDSTIVELFSKSLYNDASLVSYWRFEGNSNDSKGSNNGTDTSINYSTNNGVFNQGAGFTAGSSMITVGTDSSLNCSTAITISMWVRPTTFSAGAKALYFRGNAAFTSYLDLRQKSNAGNLEYITAVGGTETDWATDASHLVAGGWTHVAVVHTSGNEPVIYINGYSVSITKTFGSGTSLPNVASGLAGFGEEIDTVKEYGGAIDDAAIFSRALSASEVLSIFLEGRLSKSFMITKQAVNRASTY